MESKKEEHKQKAKKMPLKLKDLQGKGGIQLSAQPPTMVPAKPLNSDMHMQQYGAISVNASPMAKPYSIYEGDAAATISKEEMYLNSSVENPHIPKAKAGEVIPQRKKGHPMPPPKKDASQHGILPQGNAMQIQQYPNASLAALIGSPEDYSNEHETPIMHPPTLPPQKYALPPGKRGYKSPGLKPQHSEEPQPYAEVVDRKNLRDLAYQQIIANPPMYQAQKPLAPMQYPIPQGNEFYPEEKMVEQKIKNHYHDQGDNSAPMKEEKEGNPKENKSTKPSYKQYTLKDYKEIKPQKYYAMGGLGANVGTDAWKKKKEKLERMTEYAKSTSSMHKGKIFNDAARMSTMSKVMLPEYEESLRKRLRMKEYSKLIPKPKPPPISAYPGSLGENDLGVEEHFAEPLSELDKLEMKHREYLEQVAKQKGQIN